MKLKTALSLIISLILTVGYVNNVQAVTDAELEALEKQIEQQEAVEKKKNEAEAKGKAEQKRKVEVEAKRKEEEASLAELERQRVEAKKRAEEERRKKNEDRLVELERQRQEEDVKKKASEQQRLLDLEKERIEEKHQIKGKVVQAILGKWETDFGVLIFYEISDEQIGGNYSGLFVNDGTIIGSFEGDRLSGYWFQNSAAVGCSKEHNGYAYWGHFVYQFQHKYKEFKGKWGYCDDEKTNTWNGMKSE